MPPSKFGAWQLLRRMRRSYKKRVAQMKEQARRPENPYHGQVGGYALRRCYEKTKTDSPSFVAATYALPR